MKQMIIVLIAALALAGCASYSTSMDGGYVRWDKKAGRYLIQRGPGNAGIEPYPDDLVRQGMSEISGLNISDEAKAKIIVGMTTHSEELRSATAKEVEGYGGRYGRYGYGGGRGGYGAYGRGNGRGGTFYPASGILRNATTFNLLLIVEGAGQYQLAPGEETEIQTPTRGRYLIRAIHRSDNPAANGRLYKEAWYDAGQTARREGIQYDFLWRVS